MAGPRSSTSSVSIVPSAYCIALSRPSTSSPPITCFGPQIRRQLGGLAAGPRVVAEIDVRSLVHAAVVDPPVGVLDCGGLDGCVSDAIGVAQLAKQDPVRHRYIVLPGIGPGAGGQRNIGGMGGRGGHGQVLFTDTARGPDLHLPSCAYVVANHPRLT